MNLWGSQQAETLAETIESGPLCITDLLQTYCSLFLIYTYFLINFLILLLALYNVTFQCGHKNIFRKFKKFILPTKSFKKIFAHQKLRKTPQEVA